MPRREALSRLATVALFAAGLVLSTGMEAAADGDGEDDDPPE